MAKIDVLDWDKKKVGSAELDADIFEKPAKKAVLHAIVKWQLASRRRGTHKAKNKSEVSGGGKKPFKQKGTGSARQGSSRSPLLVGGGAVFGPVVRDYSYTLPRKMKREGLRSAVAYLYQQGKLFVVDSMESTGKTKELSARLKKFGVTKAVLIDAKAQDTAARASKNLPKFRYYSVDGLNVYDLLKYDTAIISKDSISLIEERCGAEK
jgi:large subunit ribosomal protein L4